MEEDINDIKIVLKYLLKMRRGEQLTEADGMLLDKAINGLRIAY